VIQKENIEKLWYSLGVQKQKNVAVGYYSLEKRKKKSPTNCRHHHSFSSSSLFPSIVWHLLTQLHSINALNCFNYPIRTAT